MARRSTIARHRTQQYTEGDELTLASDHPDPRKTALDELNALRRSIETRSGIYLGNPIEEARTERERQRESVLSPVGKK